MQKIKFLGIASLISLLTPLHINAAETRQDMVNETEAIVSQMNDGTEAEYIYTGDELSAKYKQTLKAQIQDSLTEEQEENGWLYYDGHAYPPNSLAGEAGDFIRGEGDVNPDYCGYVQFKANVPNSVRTSVYIEIMDVDTFVHYAYILDPANDYKAPARVPVGTFIITEGSPLDDYTGRYIVSQSFFTVEKGGTSSVSVLIADREEQFNKYKDIDNVEEQANAVKEDTDSVEETKSFNIMLIIGIVLVLSMFIIAIIRFIKKIRNKEDQLWLFQRKK